MDTNVPRRRGRQIAKGFVVDYKILTTETATASGGSAVVIASLGGNSIMRRLYALEKIFSEKQGNEQKYYENALSLLEI